jgi:signal transduction histidine kinase
VFICGLKETIKMKKILFIDDEQLVLEGLKRLLREFRKEWEFFFAISGEEALTIVKKQEIDLIISDVRMPNMSGLELLERLKSNKKTDNIPVVILTGDQERTLKRQALDLGAVDLLNKPISKEDLISRIKNVLRLKEYRDIILRRNEALKEQLVVSQKMELVGIMAAGAIHDIKNLLSIIIGYSNLFIEDAVLSQQEAQNMNRIRRAGEKASDLVNQILRFTRLEGEIYSVNMGQLIDDVLAILEVSIPEHIEVNWNRPAKDILIEGSSIKYQQVLMNILINAIQALGKKGILKISLQRAVNDHIQVDVQDNGPGINQQSMERMFDPLFTTKEHGKGTGLGLFVVKHIIDEYKGKIEVQSEEGSGTLIKIFLPVKQ